MQLENELSVEEKDTVNIPIWLGAGVIITGMLLLVVRREV